MPVPGMGRVERAAIEADPETRREQRQAHEPGRPQREPRQRRGHGRVWPDPRTRYLKEVSCSTPTGPRACIRPVAMPISAPKPNSPPSANCVDALWSTIAESTSRRKRSAAAASSVTMASVWCEPNVSMWPTAASSPSTTRTAMIASRYSDRQSASLAGTTRASACRAAASPLTSQPASSRAAISGCRCVGRAGAIDEQRLGRPADAGAPHLRVDHDRPCHREVGGRVDEDVHHAFEVSEDRDPRLRLDPRHKALAAARDDHVEVSVEPGEHRADGCPVPGRHEADRLRAAGRPPPSRAASRPPARARS